MEGPTILVFHNIYNRQMAYISGVMTCRSMVNGVSLSKKLSKSIVLDLEEVEGANKDHLNKTHTRFIESKQNIMQSNGTH
jgi:hypothetical protein